MSTETMLAGAWRVHIPTVDATCVRLACPRAGEDDPWPLSRALTEIESLGAERHGRPRALGAGRGVPLVHSQELRWHGCALVLEAHHARTGGLDEVALTLPAWNELEQALPGEDALWDLVDTVAGACAARHGALGDGEAMELEEPADGGLWVARLRRHAGLLLRDAQHVVFAGHGAPYRTLPRSDLTVVLR